MTVITCNVCKTPFSKLAYLKRHKAKFHPVAETVTSLEDSQPTGTGTSGADSKPESAREDFEDWDNDPGVEFDLAVSDSSEISGKDDEQDNEESVEETELPKIKVTEELKVDDTLILGRIERKRTAPEKPRAPIRKKNVGGQRRGATREEKRMIAELDVSGVRVKIQRTDRASNDRAV